MKRSSLALALWAATVVATVVVLFVLFTPSPPTSKDAGPPPSAGVAAGPADHDVDAVSAGVGEEKDFQNLVDAALRIRDREERRRVLAGVLTEWLQVDAAGFEKYLMRLEVDGHLEKLALLADGLADALAGLDDATARSAEVIEPVRRFILHLTREDPEKALEWADRWLEDDVHESTLVQIAGAFARRDPAEGIAIAKTLKGQLRRMQAYAIVGSVWAETDGAAAVEWASTIHLPTERAMALNATLMSWAQYDPASAAARLSSAELSMAQDYYAQYLTDLATMNVTEADLTNAPELYEEMAAAGTIPPPTSSDVQLLADAARVIASKLALGDPAAGTAWAEALADEFLRLNAVKGALGGWSHDDPAAAAAFVAERYGEYQEMVTAVYETWADAAPPDAAAATRLLDDPTLRASATEAVVEAWAADHPARAARWVDTLPQAEQTDAIRLAVVTALSESNPEAAWARARAIQDPSMQYRALKTAFSELVIQKPATARDLLAASNLTGRTAERLEELLASGEVG